LRSYVYDEETGLYYLQSRYYDPEIGRFINADAFVSTGQGLLGNNMFAYCLNNPVRYVDVAGFLAHDALEIGDNDNKLDPNDDGAPSNGSIAVMGSPNTSHASNGNGSAGNNIPSSSGGNPLTNITYSNKVLTQMQQGDDHGFPPIVDNYGSYSIQSSEVGRDGQTYSHLRIYGSYKGAEGYFHYIWDNNFTCNHRQFERVLHQ